MRTSMERSWPSYSMPRRALKISSRENPPGVRRQQPEQVELGAGQLDGGPVQPGLAHRVVDHQATERQAFAVRRLGARFRRLAAPQQSTDARQQHTRAHRLAHVVVGAHLQAEHLVHVVGARGEHQDRTVELRTHLAADGQAVLARQHQVEHHQVRAFGEDTRRRQRAVGFNVDLQAVAFQVFPGQLGQASIVLDDQDAPGFLLHTASSYRGPGAAVRPLRAARIVANTGPRGSTRGTSCKHYILWVGCAPRKVGE